MLRAFTFILLAFLLFFRSFGQDQLMSLGKQDHLAHPAPVPDFVFENTCLGDSVHFINRSYNASAYFWIIFDEIGDTLFSSSEFEPKYKFDSIGTYSILLTAYNGHIAQIKKSLVITDNFLLDFEIKIPCVGYETQFLNLSNCANNFVWKFGVNNDLDSSSNPLYEYYNESKFKVTLYGENKQGQWDSITKVIQVYDGGPDPSFTAIVYGDTVKFEAIDTNITSYIWYFGDGDTSLEKSPTHVYAPNELFPVSLTAFNPCGITYSTDVVDFTTNTNSSPELTRDLDLEIYPNPASSFVTIQFYNNDDQWTDLKLLDVTGKLIDYKRLDRASGKINLTINTNGFKRGIYFLNILSGNGASITKKIILQ